ncbi:hypothetical protein [Hydrogenophaga palleronii]|uniref:hypothetical protein n=1 Tax=Hydrogenophaga palleronii TaxID=65655 RepID=UPI000825B644|nr:hypothetical protein [Hydrogenophaga palleronii]
MSEAAPPPRHVLVAGAGGATGSAVLHELLGETNQDRVTVLTTRAFLQTTARLDHAVVRDAAGWADALPAADHAVIVFGTARRAREAVYWQPARADLLPLARALHARGVRSLEVVLAEGGLDVVERLEIQRIGFHTVTDRRRSTASVIASGQPRGIWPERLAAWMIHLVVSTMQQLMRGKR